MPKTLQELAISIDKEPIAGIIYPVTFGWFLFRIKKDFGIAMNAILVQPPVAATVCEPTPQIQQPWYEPTKLGVRHGT